METLTSISIHPLSEVHYPRVKAIYEQGILTQNATLETTAPDWDIWNAGHLPHSRLILSTPDEAVAGWAALSPVSGRCVYGGVAEVSVYIEEAQRGKGLGKALLQELIKSSETHGIWTLQAGILKGNEASVALHQNCGFRVVGMRERLGLLRGQWRDTFLLERRSAIVGV